jgi:hypothetical protein
VKSSYIPANASNLQFIAHPRLSPSAPSSGSLAFVPGR